MADQQPILVVGSAGQVARSLAQAGERHGVPIVTAQRPALDITRPDDIARALADTRPCAIINAAGYTAVDRAEAEPECAFAVNRDGAAHLAAAAARDKIPFIHISTDYVFDGSKATPYCEDDLPHPLGVYGQSKLAGEHAVMQQHPDAVVVRTSWVYSPHGTNFVRTMLALTATREPVRVVNDQHGAPTAAADLADALLALTAQMGAQSPQGRAGIYHLTGAGETTWYGFAAAIFADWSGRGRRVPRLDGIATADYPTPARRPANSRLNCRKIEQTFHLRLPLWSMSLRSCLDELAGTDSC